MENVTDEAVSQQTGSPEAQIAEMIAANRRNNPQPIGSKEPPGGQEEAIAESPQATPEEEVEPEEGASETKETVNQEDGESSDGENEPVNFFEFAEQNPEMRLRIPNRNAEGGFVEITAKKAATLLGQTSALDENSRKLKAERADFEEYEVKRRAELDGLQIGIEMTLVPQLQSAADELITLQGYNQQWTQIRDRATTELERSEAEAAIRQNSQLIQEKSTFIQNNRPKVEQFLNARSEFVKQNLDKARQSFTDRELANKANFEELREKLSKDWKSAKATLVPGVPNIDLISSDEYLLGLIRDGMKFREKPVVRNVGGSIAASIKSGAKAKTTPSTEAEKLQQASAKGDKNATRELLATMLATNKQRRK
jgi:hypothetical protein